MHAVRLVIIAGTLAALVGCGSAVNGVQGRTQGNGAGVTMSGNSSNRGSPASAGEVTVTEADSGRTVHLHIGQRLRVVLGGRGDQWHRPASHGPSLRLMTASGGYPSRRLAEAVFVAVRAGTASVTSMTDRACLHTQPRCLIAQRVWTVRARVAAAA